MIAESLRRDLASAILERDAAQREVAELRESIAREIEALPIDHRRTVQDMPTGLVTFARMEAHDRAARIARGLA